MQTKALEIRDIGTFIPVIATLMLATGKREIQEGYLLRRNGYSQIHPSVMICRMGANGAKGCASYDPYGWSDSRTMLTAHEWIEKHWDKIESGDVIDVQFILGETAKPKKSERTS
jgi:hypothetical protein